MHRSWYAFQKKKKTYSGVPKSFSDTTRARAELSATLHETEPRKYYTCAITRSKAALNMMHIFAFLELEQEDMGEACNYGGPTEPATSAISEQ